MRRESAKLMARFCAFMAMWCVFWLGTTSAGVAVIGFNLHALLMATLMAALIPYWLWQHDVWRSRIE